MIRALILTLALAAPAHAGPDRVSILTGSRHIGTDYPFQEVNPGLFLTWEDRAFGLDYSLGAYRNSFGKLSVAATAALPLIDRDRFQIALFGGLAIYPGDGDKFLISAGDAVPVAGLQARYGNGFVQIMPGDGMAIVAFGLTFPVN